MKKIPLVGNLFLYYKYKNKQQWRKICLIQKDTTKLKMTK